MLENGSLSEKVVLASYLPVAPGSSYLGLWVILRAYVAPDCDKVSGAPKGHEIAGRYTVLITDRLAIILVTRLVTLYFTTAEVDQQ